MIKPEDRFVDIFKEFPRLKRQMIGRHIGYGLLLTPYVHRWFEKKTIKQTALMMNIDVESVIGFINHKIAENTGCFDKESTNQECFDAEKVKEGNQFPGFYNSSETEMEKMEIYVKNNSPEKIINLDVSDLPAPEPLMKIREAISSNPPPLLVKATHRKVPVHLPGYLKDKPYEVFVAEKNNKVMIYVFDRKLLSVVNE